jgi:hypothetical protein
MITLDDLMSTKTHAQHLVDEQAEMSGLWFGSDVALVRQALRDLHEAVEKDTKCQEECIKSLARLRQAHPIGGSVN